ncbi:hypothetical protein PTTG_01011 [Puccinia triticina 1-1 BBBD Race 1]|uniref:Senescence domain-containing protein n=1 Tax=Puccinia triticina (isolate 1-1 / race 1 (BBBD)) TaxID=630390 RepID=A0A180GVP2_PUCT1|nr:hypothetical protein PTTG_01011 [Puccinia triticina 1-1 BBBD Race 1]
MAQGTLLLSITDVTVHQLSPSTTSSPPIDSTLFAATVLNLQLVDIPSTALKSIPSVSEPPPYSNLEKSNAQNHPSQPTVETWLVLSLADGLIDIPLSQSSQISFQQPRSYLVPILPGDAGPAELDNKAAHQALVRIDIASHVPDDTIDTLDSILAGWTQYPGRQSASQPLLSVNQIPSKSVSPPPPSHPSASSSFPKEKPASNQSTSNGASKSPFPSEGRLALMDESTGEICGELTSDVKFQGPAIAAHAPPYPAGPSHQGPMGGGPSGAPHLLLAAPQPVMVSLSPSAQGPGHSTAQVSAMPAGGGSQILSGAEWVSRGILAGSEVISSMIKKSGSSYLASAKPAAAPITFSSTTHANADKVLGFTRSATKVSGKAASLVGSVFSKVGDTIGKSTGIQRSPSGAPPSGARGYVHKGLVAFNTVMDSLETGGKKVLATAGDTTTEVVTHAYGAEAGQIAHRANHAVRNVGLVYIDARGVTRRAILKSVGKAAVRGRMNDGREVILGSDENVDHWSVVDNQPHPHSPNPDLKNPTPNHTDRKDHKS